VARALKLRLVHQQLFQTPLEFFLHPVLARPTTVAIDEDMDEFANSLYLFLAMFKNTDFICNRTLAQFVNSQCEVHDSRKFDRSQVIAVRVYDEADLR